MYQAIVTNYHGPTDAKPSGRMSARVHHGDKIVRITRPYRHVLTPEDNHREVIRALANKLNWRGIWHGASIGRNDGAMVWVCLTHNEAQVVAHGDRTE